MTEDTEYEIVYSLRRRLPNEEDFTEIGFGISGAWDTPKHCAHNLSSDIDTYMWETEGDMPDPDEIKRDVESVGWDS